MSSRATLVLRDIRLRAPPVPDNVCFYCDKAIFERGNITKQMIREGNGHRANDATEDHIFPVRDMGRNMRETEAWKALNKVPCCSQCNAYKGHLRPLDWLVIMPSDIGADRLAIRLGDLGAMDVDIQTAMRRRA